MTQPKFLLIRDPNGVLDMMINETLKMLRTVNGMTGKELADHLGISTSYLSEIENGRKAPSLELLEKFSDIFDVRLSTLILFTEEMQSENISTAKIKTRDKLFHFMKFLEQYGAGLDNDETNLILWKVALYINCIKKRHLLSC